MTDKQIKILTEHGDIISGVGNLILFLNGKLFGFSNEFHKALTQIFKHYLYIDINGDGFMKGQSELFKERVENRINENLITKDQKIIYLHSKIQVEILALDKLRKDYLPWEQSLKDINERWTFKFDNIKIENLIKCFKFKILAGNRIESFDFPTLCQSPNFYLMDEYFLSKEMEEIYAAVAIEENIQYLQKKIIDLESDQLLPSQQSKIKKQKPEELISLKDIFISNTSFSSAISALQKVKAVDKNNSNLIGSKLKGVMQVWISILKNDRKTLKAIDDKHLTTLLNKHFKKLDLSEKTDGKQFRNPINKSAEKTYRAKLIALM